MTFAKYSLIQLSGVLLLFTAGSCHKDEPCATCPPQPKDPRTFTWVRDTLADGSYQSGPSGIWGSAPNDVYVTSWGSSLFIGKLWRYDGKKWNDLTPIYVEAFPRQQIFQFACEDVFGFGKNDVWVVGGRDTSVVWQQLIQGYVMHYDGAKWTGMVVPEARELLAVWGASSTDLWAGGYAGSMFHYEGNAWQRYVLDDSLLVIQIRGTGGTDIYATGWSLSSAGLLHIRYYHWNGSSWSLVESRFDNDPGVGFGPRCEISGGTLYSLFGSTVTRRVSPGVWQQVLSDPTETFWNVSVSTTGDVYAQGGSFGEVLYHYNGKDWYRFPQFTNSNIALGFVWSNGEETFVTGKELNGVNGWPRSFVLHGK